MKATLTFLTLLILNSIFAQDNLTGRLSFLGTENQVNSVNITTGLEQRFGRKAIRIDDNGIEIENYLDSPMLLSEWAPGKVAFTDNKVYNLPALNYDAIGDHFIMYLKDIKKSIEGVVSKDFPIIGLQDKSIVTVTMQTSEGPVKFARVNSIRFNSQPKTKFLQYFSHDIDHAYLLKSTYKKISHNSLRDLPYSDNPEEYAFKTYSSYYMLNNNKIYVPVQLGKKSILKALHDKSREKELKKYIKSHKLKMNKPEDVQKLLAHYYKH